LEKKKGKVGVLKKWKSSEEVRRRSGVPRDMWLMKMSSW
jgi:hypothetical protein